MTRTAAVVGYGSIGQRHARILRAMGDWEVPVIAQGIGALDCEAAVLVEKPLCRASAEAKPLAQHPNASRAIAGYVLRHSALFRRAREIVDAGDLGEIVSFQVMLGAYETLVVARNRFAAAEANTLYFDYSHEWDYLAWFLGPVAQVTAAAHQSGARPLTQNPNVTDALLRLESGATGTVHLDYVQSPGARRFSLVGDRGTLEGDYTAAAPLVSIADAVQSVRVAEALIRSVESGKWERV